MLQRDTEDMICIVDDDAETRGLLSGLLRSAGYQVRTFNCPRQYLADGRIRENACVVADAATHEAAGLDMPLAMVGGEAGVPVIFMTGQADVATTVRAMKAGAANVLAKPFEDRVIIAAVAEAVAAARARRPEAERIQIIRQLYATLTGREREVMALVTAGLMNKQVALRLNLCEITVKIHRGHMMRKMRAQSLPELVRMADLLGV
jgi:FixJ family two-component response regulator